MLDCQRARATESKDNVGITSRDRDTWHSNRDLRAAVCSPGGSRFGLDGMHYITKTRLLGTPSFKYPYSVKLPAQTQPPHNLPAGELQTLTSCRSVLWAWEGRVEQTAGLLGLCKQSLTKNPGVRMLLVGLGDTWNRT